MKEKPKLESVKFQWEDGSEYTMTAKEYEDHLNSEFLRRITKDV